MCSPLSVLGVYLSKSFLNVYFSVYDMNWGNLLTHAEYVQAREVQFCLFRMLVTSIIILISKWCFPLSPTHEPHRKKTVGQSTGSPDTERFVQEHRKCTGSINSICGWRHPGTGHQDDLCSWTENRHVHWESHTLSHTVWGLARKSVVRTECSMRVTSSHNKYYFILSK